MLREVGPTRTGFNLGPLPLAPQSGRSGSSRAISAPQSVVGPSVHRIVALLSNPFWPIKEWPVEAVRVAPCSLWHWGHDSQDSIRDEKNALQGARKR